MRSYILPAGVLLSISACQHTGRGYKNTTATGTYEFKNDSLQQRLNILSVTEDHITFNYYIDPRKDTGMVLGGNAYYTTVINSQKDKDEKGNEYEVNQYVYGNGNCRIIIRISKEPNTMAQVTASNCDAICHGLNMTSAGVLKLKAD